MYLGSQSPTATTEIWPSTVSPKQWRGSWCAVRIVTYTELQVNIYKHFWRLKSPFRNSRIVRWSYRQEFLQKRKLQTAHNKHHINVLTTFGNYSNITRFCYTMSRAKQSFFCKWRKYHIPQLIFTWCPLAWRASAASTTRRSAPPIPRSGCRKTTRAILLIRISSGNMGGRCRKILSEWACTG